MEKQILKIKRYIDNVLSKEQAKVCQCQENHFVVYACPGSGKTKTVGTRFAWRMAHWENRRSGIAVLSFTNVAWLEIARQLQELGLPPRPSWPHFLGTIDSFVNQFIFLPFGHIVMGCNRRPEIVHNNNIKWVNDVSKSRNLGNCYRKGCSATSFRFKADGSLEYCEQRRQPSCQRDQCHSVKQAMVTRGFAHYSDAMYWGMKVLKLSHIREAVTARFSEIIIDEAQDTSETQVRIIKNLVDAGCKIVLVGDPDQAIYSFNNARPDLFQEFATKGGWKQFPLSANFRSSQQICDATYPFSTILTNSPTAKGADMDFPAKPIILKYAAGEEISLVERFRSILKKYVINTADSAVLARRHNMVTKLFGLQQRNWPNGVKFLTKSFAKAATYRDLRLHGEAHEIIMWAFLYLCFGKGSFGHSYETIHDIGLRAWRRKTWKVLQNLPNSNTNLSEWGPQVLSVIKPFIDKEGWPCHSNLGRNFTRCNHASALQPVSYFIQSQKHENDLLGKVIHQAKGETYEAVMVVADFGNRNNRSDIDQWLTPQTNEENDERRVGYVAMTRPRKILVLAVPDTSNLNDLEDCFDIMDNKHS